MQTAYKIVEEREENGLIYQKVRYYQGQTTTEDELNPSTGQVEPVERFRFGSMYEEVEYWYE